MTKRNQPNCQRIILHLDMDAFYASVEVLDRPELLGKPVIVGGDSHRGVVSAASYEARRYGVHSALPMVTARRRCPDGIFLPVRMARYQEVSAVIFALYRQITPLVEPLSLDEAFLDVSGSMALFGSGEQMARTLKEQVRQETGLTVSAGVAANKLVAKIASDLEKPDGLTVVEPGGERNFLAPLPIAKLWGVGKVTREQLKLIGVTVIGDLCRLSPVLLETKFGKLGPWLHRSAHGHDDRPVEPERLIKSIGHEETFAVDLVDHTLIRQELLALAGKVGRRLRRRGLFTRTVTIKIKYQDFSMHTRAITLPTSTADDREIYRQALILLKKTEAGKRPVRLLGISLSQLGEDTGGRQLSLFIEDQQGREKRHMVNQAVDAIHDRFGGRAIQPATLLQND